MAKMSLAKTREAVEAVRNGSTDIPTREVVLYDEPWNGDVKVYVFPKTRALTMKAIEKAKQNPKSRRHKEKVDGKITVVEGDPDAAFVDEMADMLISHWEGVEDDGVPSECNRENKILLFEHVKISNYLIAEAEKFAEETEEEAEGNE